MAIRLSHSHAEIDGLGLTILKDMGYSDASAAFHYLKDSIFPGHNINNIETVHRMEMIQKDFMNIASAASKQCQEKTENQKVKEWIESGPPKPALPQNK